MGTGAQLGDESVVVGAVWVDGRLGCFFGVREL